MRSPKDGYGLEKSEWSEVDMLLTIHHLPSHIDKPLLALATSLRRQTLEVKVYTKIFHSDEHNGPHRQVGFAA